MFAAVSRAVQSKIRAELSALMWVIRVLRWKLLRRFMNSVRVKTSQGIFRVFTWDRYISRPLFVEGTFEKHEINKFFAWLKERDEKCSEKVLVDAGANIGVIGISFLRFGFCRSCLFIEPDAKNLSVLSENIRLNKLENRSVVFGGGVSDREGEYELEHCADNSGDHRVRMNNASGVCPEYLEESRRTVSSVRLAKVDDLVSKLLPGQSVGAVWADVQGHEVHLIRGGSDLWSAGVPLFMEFCPYMILRSGETKATTADAVKTSFRNLGIWRRGRFVVYPSERVLEYWDEIGEHMEFDNILLFN